MNCIAKMKYLFILFLFIQLSLQSQEQVEVRKHDRVLEEQDKTVTSLKQLKRILREKEVFDWDDKSLTAKDKKELAELEDLLEVTMFSRVRQPENVQRVFSPLHRIQEIVKKLYKEKVISKDLVDKFKWARL